MKNLLGILMVAAILAFPVFSFAVPIGTDYMDVDASSPIQGNYYADYDAVTLDYGFLGLGVATDVEIFCTENADMNGSNVQYTFFTVDDSLSDYGLSDGQEADLIAATWYANWFDTVSDGGETAKATAQTAIWLTLGFYPGGTYTAADALIALYDAATDQDAYAGNWLLAVNPDGDWITIGENGQNYLVPNPVPEPATMLLIGTGLIGLAGLGRRRMRKK